MKTRQHPVRQSAMVVDSYAVLMECIERGYDYGFRRAHKHCENPDAAAIREEVLQGITTAVCDKFTFPTTTRT